MPIAPRHTPPVSPAKKLRRAIVITGLVRDEARFLRFLDSYKQHPTCRQIPLYYSTWTSEINKYPGLSTALANCGGTVIEQPEVDIKLTGHALHQIVSIDAAISFLDPKTFVLKCRPDFLDMHLYELFLKIIPEQPDNLMWAYPNQSCKFYITHYFAAHPFYIGDITFAGCAGDMRHLTCYPLSALYKYTLVAPEQIIWSGALLPFVTAMDCYFRCNIGLIFSNNRLSITYHDTLAHFDLYAEVLGIYYLLLESAFGSFTNSYFGDYESLKRVTLEELLWSPLHYLPQVAHNPSCYTNSISHLGIADLIRKRGLAESPLLQRVRMAMDTYVKGILTLRPAHDLIARASSFALEWANMNLLGCRTPSPTPVGWMIGESHPSWFPIHDRNPYVHQLEQEVNTLRRTIDSLNERLALGAD